jgi:hypothetical protein
MLACAACSAAAGGLRHQYPERPGNSHSLGDYFANSNCFCNSPIYQHRNPGAHTDDTAAHANSSASHGSASHGYTCATARNQRANS